ncbi:MAG: hypothetical protein AB7D35_04930 [Bacteroidales bacterium]|jgi:hypothetical protein
MKKLVASILFLSFLSIGIPKITKAAAEPCATVILCDTYITVCNAEDITDWIAILCNKNEN